MIERRPCSKCGSKDILLWHYGYSAFNFGGGECLGCKKRVVELVGWNPSDDALAAAWNRGNESSFREVRQ